MKLGNNSEDLQACILTRRLCNEEDEPTVKVQIRPVTKLGMKIPLRTNLHEKT
jgi:hypothetical protein